MNEGSTVIKKIMIIILILIILGLVGFFYFKPQLMRATLPKAVMINTNNQPTLGNPNAKIHIVVFEDLKCMNCARFNNTLLPFIKKNYIDKDKAKYTLINLAFIDGSLPAANAARCVYTQNKALFFDYVDYIYTHQPPENQNWATVPTLLNFASHVSGIDINQLATCIVQSPYDQLIQDNLKEASRVMNHAVSTPSVYINGIAIKPLTQEQIQTVMDAQ
ncbi:MAG TPA: thioredoxin domain-containing protein [Coxiellaceae bacterium]|nr:thioredoxin domain-containing protein [Coxiellaceae bacterium]